DQGRRIRLLAAVPGRPALGCETFGKHGDDRSLYPADPVIRSVGIEADIPEEAGIEERYLSVFPVFLVERSVPLQAVVEELRLPAELVVGQIIGNVRERRAVLRDAVRVRDVAGGAAVKSARTEALGPGVVSEHIRQDVPRQVGAALEALVGRLQVLAIDVGGQSRARRQTRVVAGRN